MKKYYLIQDVKIMIVLLSPLDSKKITYLTRFQHNMRYPFIVNNRIFVLYSIMKM